MDTQKQTQTTLMILSLLMVWGSICYGTNLVSNGDFESGQTGFSTGYNYIYGRSRNPGNYTLDTNPANFHPSTPSYGDHTSGDGLMMIVDGIMRPNVTVWEQSLTVQPNTTYNFTYYLSYWTDATVQRPPILECFINNESIGTAGSLGEEGQWMKVSHFWQSGDNTTTATIRMVDQNYRDFGGNDFAIDDISFCTTMIDASVNIDPDTLNLKSKGKWITAYITLPESYNVCQVISDTILLEGDITADWCDIDESEQFIKAKFSRQALIDLLTEAQLLTPGEVELLVSGELEDGSYFEATDTIRIIH